MAPRTLLSSAFRQCRNCLSQQHAALSTSSKAQAFKSIFQPPSGASSINGSSSGSILDLDAPQGPQHDATDLALKYSEVERNHYAQRKVARQEETAKKLADQATSDNYMRMMPRRWRVGDVYAPRDLGPTESRKWRRSRNHSADVVDMLGINPLDSYQNFSVISEHVTTMGRIRHGNDTGLRPANQRKMAKAVRRAIGIGLHPSVHRYPEILKWSNSPFAVKSYTNNNKGR